MRKNAEAEVSDREKIMVLGGGPNRIGQGIEFDYCCVHAALAMADEGYETIMVNCNPETVSTDYNISDRLYFEPLTFEDVLEIVELEKPKGVIVQFGGQTPLNLVKRLEAAGVPVIGTSPDAIDRAEDRERFQKLIQKLQAQATASPITVRARPGWSTNRYWLSRWSSARPMCLAAAPWKSSATPHSSTATSPKPSSSRGTAPYLALPPPARRLDVDASPMPCPILLVHPWRRDPTAPH